MLLEEPEGCVALEDGILPEPERTVLRFVTGYELSYVLEHVQWKAAPLHVHEKFQLLRLSKQSGRDTLFDQRRAGAVLDLIRLRHAFPLQAKQRSDDRRPAEYGDVGVMEDVMEAVVVRLGRIVG